MKPRTYRNSGASITAIVNNPILYRGYYYDSNLGLYYLQTRYYDSSIGRFINADKYASTGTGLIGYNMYAYCNNNPVMYTDPSGENLLGYLLLTPLASVVIIGVLAFIAVYLISTAATAQSKYVPVRTVFPGPIQVTNIKIIGK